MQLLTAVVTIFNEQERDLFSWKAQSQLLALGFNEQQFDIPVMSLSGGQQNLMLIARALLLEPDLLLLDEPGNHMDILAMTKLQHFLHTDCRCAFMIISHDQHLLNNVCNKSVFLRDGSAQAYDLPFQPAKIQLEQHDEHALKRLNAEQKEISRLRATAKRLAILGRENDNVKLSRKAKSIEKRVVKLDENKTQLSKKSNLKLQLDSLSLPAKQLLSIYDCPVKSPDGRKALLTIEQLIIKPGDRIALLGVNGVGKSSTLETLLRAFEQQFSDSTSKHANITFNPRTKLGYYDQELIELNLPISRIEWLRKHTKASEEQIKNTMIKAGIGYLEFSREVDKLSGGEKSRMMFLAFALNTPNLMILDEPTNHIDLDGKAQLTEQLMHSGAALLITSHDRYFLQGIATRWLWIKEGSVQEINSADLFYQQLLQSSNSRNTTATAQSNISTLIDDEDKILKWIEMLEQKITDDKEQKIKWQKVECQKEWQNEINRLWSQITQEKDQSL